MDFQQDEEEEEEGEMSPDHMKDSEVRCCSCRFFLIYALYGFYKFTSYGFQEPSNKRVKPVGKSNSLTGVIPQMKTPALKRFSQSISVRMLKYAHAFTAYISVQIVSVILSFFSQRSISFRTEARPLPPALPRSRQKPSSFPRRRSSQCWSDTVESHDLTAKEIKRQEVRGTEGQKPK